MTATSEASIAPGTRIGRYIIRRPLGMGGMGEVYEAEDTRLRRAVALKIIRSDVAADPVRRARLEREATAVAMLNHPHIVTVHSLEDDGAIVFVTMELIEGVTLADAIPPGGFPLARLLPLATQLSDALHAAHTRGIVHRDLKPANVMLARDGTLKVLDFGLSKVGIETSGIEWKTETLTADSRLVGTAPYMAPEQIEGQPIDARGDIFALGVMLFEMATGTRPFAGQSPLATLTSILKDPAPLAGAVNADVPDEISRIIDRCLIKDPAQRTQSAADLRNQIDDLRRMLESGAWLPRGARRTTRRPHRRLALAVLAVIVAIAGIAVGTALIGGTRAPLKPAFHQLTFRHGTIRGARLASDGQSVIYGASWIGAQPGLFRVSTDNPQSGSIGIDNAGIFSVSSRGDLAIALGCRLNWGECIGTLAQVPLAGGSPRELVKDVQVADWAPDGQNLAVVSFTGGKYRLEYPLAHVLYEPDGWITSARISPGGDRIAFLDHPQLGDIGGSVAMLDMNGGRTVLSANWKALQGLAWSASGDEVWFTGSRTGKGGSSALYAVTVDGRERTVLVSPGALKLNDIARDGQHVLLTRGIGRGGIIDLTDGATAERELSWLDYSTVADLSADGKTLLFYEWGEGVAAKPTIFLRSTDGGDAIRLGEGRPLALSPDRRWVLAVQERSPQQLVVLPTGTGGVISLPRGPILEYLDWASWSPDGRRIFFAGREAGDVRRTYVQDVDRGDPKPVTPDGFVGLLLSPDGQTIAAVDRYGEYYLCRVDQQGEPRPVAGYRDGDVPLQWSANGKFLYVRDAGNLVLRVFKLDLATGNRQLWKELVPPDPTVLIDIGSDPGQVRIAPDGRSYAYTYWTSDDELYLADGLR
jgi:Tol biopolymer transport system component/tRNA A-37 threonylcarbamoyl transferase component Bud32